VIHVYLYPPFAGLAGSKKVDLPSSPELTVGGVIARLTADYPGLSGHLDARAVTCLVNGRIAAMDCTLVDGEELGLLGLATGG